MPPARLIAALAIMGSDSTSCLESLLVGFHVPEFETFIPWFVRKDELFRLIPENEFSISAGGCWPQLRFTLLGFEALFDLNFVSDSQGRLVEVQFCNYHKRKLRRSFRTTVRILRKRLGTPNLVNISWGQVTWQLSDLQVTSYLTKHSRSGKDHWREVHVFSISKFQSRRAG